MVCSPAGFCVSPVDGGASDIYVPRLDGQRPPTPQTDAMPSPAPDALVAPDSGCPGSLTQCGAVCTNLDTDPQHCGTCWNSCGGCAACVLGKCACTQGAANCDGSWVNGCETDTDNDPKNCGSCGHVCASSQCAKGKCASTPPPGCDDTVAFTCGTSGMYCDYATKSCKACSGGLNNCNGIYTCECSGTCSGTTCS